MGPDIEKSQLPGEEVFPLSKLGVELIEKFAKEAKDHPAFKDIPPFDIETVKDIFSAFIFENIAHTKIYKSEKFGASFPVSTINSAEFAMLLYKKYTGHKPHVVPSKESRQKVGKEFIFTSFLSSGSGGSTFSFYEQAINRLVQKLPAALKAIQNGEQPESFDISILGFPMNSVGSVSETFSKVVRQEGGFNAFAKLYGEYIGAQIKEDKTDAVRFVGFSMGGSLAAKTAEQMLADKTVSQDSKSDLPKVSIAAYAPVSSLEGSGKFWRFPLGLKKEADTNDYALAAARYEKESSGRVNELLERRGIKEQRSFGQKMRKLGVFGSMAWETMRGVPMSDTLKVDIIRGTEDPLIYSEGFAEKAEEKRATRPTDVRRSTVSEEKDEAGRITKRTSGILREGHTHTFFTFTDSRGFILSAHELEKIRSQRRI